MIRTAVVATSLALRAGLTALLETDDEIQVVAEAAEIDTDMPQFEEIDVLVLAAESVEQMDLISSLQTENLVPTLILLAQDSDPAEYLRAMGRQIWGLLPLESSVEELLAAVRGLHAGLFIGAPELVESLLAALPVGGAIEPLVDELTEREIEVLQLLAQGLANKQIALRLGISEHTVKFHVSGIYSKLNATNRMEAVRLGVHQGLIVL